MLSVPQYYKLSHHGHASTICMVMMMVHGYSMELNNQNSRTWLLLPSGCIICIIHNTLDDMSWAASAVLVAQQTCKQHAAICTTWEFLTYPYTSCSMYRLCIACIENLSSKRTCHSNSTHFIIVYHVYSTCSCIQYYGLHMCYMQDIVLLETGK